MVTAVNNGGESFPSEIVAVCRLDSLRPPALVINGFTRVSGPAIVASSSFSGFFDRFDAGVPDRLQVNFTGEQYDYDPSSPYRSNDAPGHGASFANQEGMLVSGNSFDFAAVHGRALRDAGAAFCTASKAAVTDGLVALDRFPLVDLILGEERATPWHHRSPDSVGGVPFRAIPKELQEQLRTYSSNGGALFVSGAYVGTDLHASPGSDSVDARFAREILKITWVTDHASRTGDVVVSRGSIFPDTLRFAFNTTLSPAMYQVEAPDAVGPADGSVTVLRYAENLFSAATAYRGTHRVVVFGFPFETVTDPTARMLLMRGILGFFGL
jgi:hypothetical protein